MHHFFFVTFITKYKFPVKEKYLADNIINVFDEKWKKMSKLTNFGGPGI